MHLQMETYSQMAVMGDHSPLLPLHFAERKITTVYLKHLQRKHIVG